VRDDPFMTWLLIALAVVFVVAIDRRQVVRGTLLALVERAGGRAYAAYVRARRARTLRWINGWRVANRLAPLGELHKGVRGSRNHGIIARNMGVFSYADGVWSEGNGRSGGVPRFVAAFARDFDDGLFADLAGRLVAVNASRPSPHVSVGLAFKQSALVS
jgi:hypothetical protein